MEVKGGEFAPEALAFKLGLKEDPDARTEGRMKTRTMTVTVREGEWLGPVDWSYDFEQHAWGPNKCGVRPESIEEGKEALRLMETEPDATWVFCRSGFPVYEIVHVGMWDGGPFGGPTPAIGFVGPMGGVEKVFFYELNTRNVSKKGAA